MDIELTHVPAKGDYARYHCRSHPKSNLNGWGRIAGGSFVYGCWACDTKTSVKLEDVAKLKVLPRQPKNNHYWLSEWTEAAPCQRHQYLDVKQLEADKSFRVSSKGVLLIPIYKGAKLDGLQRITKTGDKRMTKGVSFSQGIPACWTTYKGDRSRPVLVEGVADALAVQQATGLRGIACLFASNMPRVAELYPEAMILADPDDVGQRYAIEARNKVSGKLIMPELDAADLFRHSGPKKLRELLL